MIRKNNCKSVEEYHGTVKRACNRFDILIVISCLMFTFFAGNVWAEDNNHPTGLRKPTQSEMEWDKKNLIHVEHVKLNSIGLERVNAVRKAKKLPEISKNVQVSISKEIVSGKTVLTKSEMEAEALAVSSLPSNIDNSLLPCFPPIGNQSGLGSCACFSSTYYQMTHMTGLVRGWNAKNDPDNIRKFSPKWTYNMVNGGNDNGSWMTNAFEIALKHGVATWHDFPYVGEAEPETNYREWSTDASVWRNAINNKMEQAGDVSLGAGDTPVTSVNDDNLANIKQLLNNGYVLTFGTSVFSWHSVRIKNDVATSADDEFVDELVCSYVDGTEGGHSMTIVGYNDDIWVDINGNNIVDSGEKGAFKIANSWGDSYWNDGFIWFAYDALNKTSSVVNGPSMSTRVEGLWSNTVYWITAKRSYTPTLLGQFTLNHTKRNQIVAKIGYSDTTKKDWEPAPIFSNGGEYAFDGTQTACDGTFVFDFTELIDTYDIDNGAKKRWYLSINDNEDDDVQAILKNFKLIDVQNDAAISSTNSFPMESNYSTVLSWIDYIITPRVLSNKRWEIKFNIPVMESSINNSNIYVKDTNKNKVPVTLKLSDDGKTVNVIPSKNSYAYGKKYTLYVTKNIKSVSGKKLGEPKEKTFIIIDPVRGVKF